jgi:hypothetical protein
MQFFIYAAEKGSTPPRQLSTETLAELGKFMEEARKSGVLVGGGGLQRKSTRLRLSGGTVSVTDGPFIEGKEIIPGFVIIQVNTKEEALDWVTRMRRIYGDGESRIAQMFGPA